jgi:hypothetical protein
MLLGRFEDAWLESDRINARGKPDPNRLWDGGSFSGNRVMIRCLHGFGDAIQFIRYAALVRREASRVLVQTHPEMVSLFGEMQFADNVVSWDGDSRDWDQQIEVMELARAYRTTVATIPSPAPYLRANPARSRIRRGPVPRIGITWAASEWDTNRSLPLTHFLPIFDLNGVEFCSFQRGPRRSELLAMQAAYPIADVSGESKEIADTAADLMNMDLVITVDTMLAHLAGALGKAVWVLLPFQADWRWMLLRPDSPWYPTMKLFRQPASGDWQTPVRQIAQELSKRIAKRRCAC